MSDDKVRPVDGLTGASTRKVAARIGQSANDSQHLFGLYADAFGRRKRSREKQQNERQLARLRQIRELIDALEKVIGEAELTTWLANPNPELGGEKPSDIISRGDVGLIWRLIEDDLP